MISFASDDKWYWSRFFQIRGRLLDLFFARLDESLVGGLVTSEGPCWL